MSAALAEVSGVRRRFGDVVAVDGVSLRVAPGEIVGLLGANGAGKTTVIRLLLGLLRATEGSVRLFGEVPSRQTRRRLGYVPQSLGLYDDLTVAENLDFAAAAFDRPPAHLPAEFADRGGVLVRDLPLGLQRRLAFAEVLGHDPELLVLDEPTSGVDPLGRARLWESVRQAAERGAGVLVTTHYMEEAEQCDRLEVMNAGRVVARGTIAAIVGDARAIAVRASHWAEAFAALDRAGLPVSVLGQTVRVAGVDEEAVRSALGAGGVAAEVTDVSATFEECFAALASRTV